jgi:superfamily I DNA and/or RNA helicase
LEDCSKGDCVVDIDKHLILLKGDDQTEKISRCTYANGKWKVQFKYGKTYDYGRHSLQWFKDPQEYSSDTVIIYHNDLPLSGIEKIYVFEKHIRICFVTGYKRVYGNQEITLEKNGLTDPVIYNHLEYLKRLAEKVSVKDEGDHSFLSKQYQKLGSISPSSALATYLNSESLKETLQFEHSPIFPFGFNLSQKAATEKALTEQISVIEGPPGTGKTQTILNIIANAMMNGNTVAIVSNNNAATANVLEKLQKYDVDFIAAYLGNKENKEKFFAMQKETYPDMASWRLNSREINELKRTLQDSGNKLKEMLKTKNKVALLKQELAALSLEIRYFREFYQKESIPPYRSLYRHNADKVLSLWLDYRQMVSNQPRTSLKYKLKNLIQYGITSLSFYKNSIEQIITHLQKTYYELKQGELSDQIKSLSERLDDYQFDRAMKLYSENSMQLFKARLSERYGSQPKRKVFTRDALWKDSEFASFIKEYPVILSTTHSLRSCIKENYLFDYVIMDEASQVDIVTGALALSCAKNTVIVGDLQQLPNVVPNELAEETNLIFEHYSMNRGYHYADHSMLSSISKLYSDIPKTLLKEHYRCHPKIIGFCNQKFYNNQLIVLTGDNHNNDALVLYKLVKGNHARGNFNQREIDVILKEVLPEQNLEDSKQTVGIISPYRLQVEKLEEAISRQEIEVDTVHKFQGREKDVVILSTVVNEVNDFVNNPNLINVAVSRAVNKLVVVVSDNEKNKNGHLGDLERYIRYNNFTIVPSQIYSVFDLLYRNYSERLIRIMKQVKNKSEYKSENLMLYVIEKVLGSQEFQSLGYVMHQPLKMLIRDPHKLNKDELRYTMNILTHTDFLIFNKLDKCPVLVVEVDGYKYHAKNPRQLERDQLKDGIFAKYGIPIIRLGTNESGEESRLRGKLIEVLG